MMSWPRLLPLILFLPGLAACQPGVQSRAGPRPSVVVSEPEKWREVASAENESGIDALAETWAAALAEARKTSSRSVSAEGPLLAPNSGLSRAAPAPGGYRCRVIRLSSASGTGRAFAASKQAFCFVGVEGDQLSFTAEVAGARVGGYLWETEETKRLVFLGSPIAARAKVAPAYGNNPSQDVAGMFERIGDFRYRLTVPGRGGEAKLLVFDLTAAPAQ
jgi:hypothetical protein